MPSSDAFPRLYLTDSTEVYCTSKSGFNNQQHYYYRQISLFSAVSLTQIKHSLPQSIHMYQNGLRRPRFAPPTLSKQSTASLPVHVHHINPPPPESKRTLPQIQPRLTRRMNNMSSSTPSKLQRCIICMGEYADEYGKLQCGHVFCYECVVRWWRNHSSCPYCREEFNFVSTKKGNVYYSDLPPETKDDNDDNFIPYCELCWGEIEPFEEMNICTNCRAVYWHSRCLSFPNARWYCVECAGQEDPQQNQRPI